MSTNKESINAALLKIEEQLNTLTSSCQSTRGTVLSTALYGICDKIRDAEEIEKVAVES